MAEKIWIGYDTFRQIEVIYVPWIPSEFFQPSSCILVVYQSVCSHAIADQLQYDWIAEEKSGWVDPLRKSS